MKDMTNDWLSDCFFTKFGMNSDQCHKEMIVTLLFKCCEWLVSDEETETDVNVADNSFSEIWKPEIWQ